MLQRSQHSFDTLARNRYDFVMCTISFNAKRDLKEAKGKAIAALSEISNLALQAAADVLEGEHAKSPVELTIEFCQLLKAYEEFLEVEATGLWLNSGGK